METKHCPDCNSTELLYEIDIWKKQTSKDRYTGKISCGNCHSNFMRKDILIRTWEEVKGSDANCVDSVVGGKNEV